MTVWLACTALLCALVSLTGCIEAPLPSETQPGFHSPLMRESFGNLQWAVSLDDGAPLAQVAQAALSEGMTRRFVLPDDEEHVPAVVGLVPVGGLPDSGATRFDAIRQTGEFVAVAMAANSGRQWLIGVSPSPTTPGSWLCAGIPLFATVPSASASATLIATDTVLLPTSNSGRMVWWLVQREPSGVASARLAHYPFVGAEPWIGSHRLEADRSYPLDVIDDPITESPRL